MKKLFTLICFSAFGFSAWSQGTLAAYKTNPLNVPTATITNNGILNESTTINTSTSFTINIKNTSAVQHTYTVHRTIMYNVPTLDQTNGTSNPQSYFCFGYSCFGDATNSPPTSSDYTILGPAASSSSPYDNSHDNGTPFVLYISEGATSGNYLIKYKLQEISNPNDTLLFYVRYNNPQGVNEMSSSIESLDIFPNPSSGNTAIALDLKAPEDNVKIQVYNSLGSAVYTTSQSYSAGRHKLSLDCSNYNAGIYFITVSTGSGKITRRFVLNK